MTREDAIKYVKTYLMDEKYRIEALETLIPELKESEDEKIRKEIIDFLWKEKIFLQEAHLSVENSPKYRFVVDAISWLEKQDKIDRDSYEIAEKEKYDFVNGKFIECRKSFYEFKEDNSYWLEYVGNDTYIGRSDNILNKKFHITPRQLYSLFTQQHCPNGNNANKETNAPTDYGKYVDECLNEAAKHFFSEGEDKYSVADLFYAGVRCGQSWFEKQGEQKLVVIIPKFRIGDEIKTSNEESLTITKIDKKGYWSEDLFICGFDEEYLWNLVEKKSANKGESKFNVGDWVIDKQGIVHQIANVVENITSHTWGYDIVGGGYFNDKIEGVRLWTVQDAKDGDVLAVENRPFIYNGEVNPLSVGGYCGITTDGFLKVYKERHGYGFGGWTMFDRDIYPATNEQRKLLFEKIKDAGYKWDRDKKELIKL